MVIAQKIRDGEQLPDFSIPDERRKMTAQALEAWRTLKRSGATARQENLPLVATIVEYLGFRLEDVSPVSLVPSSTDRTHFQHWRVLASARGFSPVPQFGSQRENRYDIIGTWKSPGPDLLGALSEQKNRDPMILFYFGRLVGRPREELLRLTRRKGLPLLVLDEVLFLFLAREYDVRLRSFFQCALPFATLNPFVPFVAGSVPPEMFVGRSDMVAKLRDPLGPAFVYGGRQLGKSALLREVFRQVSRPDQGQYAILMEVKPIGDPKSGAEHESTFWRWLADEIGRLKASSMQTIPASADGIRKAVLTMLERRDRRLVLFLDEADNLLEADAGQNFHIVNQLKSLMAETERRFKVIFAGLHNVQRFNHIPNQPLAHMGDPIEVGPLEPEAAMELLERPLRALGFCFGPDADHEDRSVLLQILSYTNYHAGLIQLFGHHLVEHLQAKYAGGTPPFPITRSDVEAVYLHGEGKVCKDIRDRFTWTLALDERYEAIALSLILEQWDARNGFDQMYRPQELHAVATNWWPAGFGGAVNTDQFQGYLDEMVGLGVLSRVEGNRYRLRSPNLVHLLGNQDNLIERLDAISKSPAPEPLRVESHHALVNGSYSPLSYAQERVLNASRAGVGLVFGSAALGIDSLRNASKRFVAAEDMAHSNESWEEIRLLARGGDALRQWLRKYNEKHRYDSRIVLFRDLEGTPAEMQEQVATAVDFCRSFPKKAVRIILALDSSWAWEWFLLDSKHRSQTEQQVDVVMSLKRWDAIGIRQRLEEHKPSIGHLHKRILEVTGGWPWLMDKFIDMCAGDDPELALKDFQAALTDDSSGIRQGFIRALGIVDGLPSQH